MVPIIAWMLGAGVLAAVVLAVGRARGGLAAAEGVAGGLLFSIGDLSTKVATEGGARFLFVITLVIGYTLGSSLLQLGYQRGGTLTVAGLATLCTNALPIIAGTVLLAEPVPAGVLGVLRVVAFCAVVAGAILLATPDHAAAARPAGGRGERRRAAAMTRRPQVSRRPDDDVGDQIRAEQPVADDSGNRVEPDGERAWILGHLAEIVGEDPAVRRRLTALSDASRAEHPQRRRQPEALELQRDGRTERRDALVRGGDDDEPLGRGGDDLLAQLRAVAALHRPTIVRDLVGAVDRDVQSLEPIERLHPQPERAGVGLGLDRGGDAAEIRQLSGREQRQQAGDGPAGAEADRHTGLDQCHRGLCGFEHLLILRSRHQSPRSSEHTRVSGGELLTGSNLEADPVHDASGAVAGARNLQQQLGRRSDLVRLDDLEVVGNSTESEQPPHLPGTADENQSASRPLGTVAAAMINCRPNESMNVRSRRSSTSNRAWSSARRSTRSN